MPAQDDRIARNEATVPGFLKGRDDIDVGAGMAQVTEDMCYLTQPREAFRGKENVCKMIRSSHRRSAASSS